MFELMSGIRITGVFFGSSYEFTPFSRLLKNNKETSKSEKPKTTAIIYGKNGSGKSTLAKAISEYKAKQFSTFSSVELIDDENRILDITENYRNHIYVFNEEFINNNIRFKSDEKLDAIVMLGKMGNLADKIEQVEKKIENFEHQKQIIEEELKKYEDENEVISPLFYKNKIKKILKEEWAKKDQEIRGNAIASKVTNELMDNFLNYKFSKSEDMEEIKQEYGNKLIELKKLNQNECIEKRIEIIPINKFIDDTIYELLAKSIEEPLFTEKEKDIINILNLQSNTNYLDNIKNVMSNQKEKCCPFCFQNLTIEYKAELLNSISRIFDSHQALKYRNQLNKFHLEPIQIDLKIYTKIDDFLVNKIENLIIDYNNYLSNEVLAKIEKKKINIYTPVRDFRSNIFSRINEINSLLTELEAKRKAFNEKFISINEIKKDLLRLNKKIYLHELKDDIKLYQEKKGLLECRKHIKAKYENIINKLSNKKECLEAKKSNIHLAINLINKYLSYIFFSPDRLLVELHNDKYLVKSRGYPVRLSQLSEGEKNVIALCYFFSSIASKQRSDDFFKEEYFIVLDDPISSFDFNNKIGIYSFLRYILGKIHTGNKNSRVLIFTHQIDSIFNLQKVIGDIGKFDRATNCKYFILEDKKISHFSENHYEYNRLLQNIFKYADNQADQTIVENINENIGNIMRRVLEAFATFNYQKGTEALFRDKEILKIIPEDDKQDFFRNLMCRLVLNSESHYQYQINSLPEFDFFSYISAEEKRNTAKQIIIFLKLINPLHIKSHLKDENCIQKINEWEKEFFP